MMGLTLQELQPDPAVLAVLVPPRRSWRWAAGIGGGLLLLGGGALALRDGPAAYDTAAVTQGTLTQRVTAVGQLEPIESVEIGSDQSGKISTVLVAANDTVAAGAVLARLDPKPFENAVAQARAQWNAQQAALQQALVTERGARLELERTERLLAKGAATRVELEDARLQVDSAAASVATARAQVALQRAALQEAEDNLADTTITAPISGVVTRRLVEPGQTVVSAMSATALFEIASDLRTLKATVSIDEADVGKVHAGQPATFTVSAWPERQFQASLTTVDIAPVSDESVVSYEASLSVQNDDLALRPGLTATAEIEIARVENVLFVPSSALRWRPIDATVGPGEWVWRLQEGEPEAIAVTVLGADGLQTAIRADALQPADQVITGERRP